MLTATFLAPFLVPMFFLVITEKVFKSKRSTPEAPGHPALDPTSATSSTP
jgi:hypothetical protein